MPWDRVHDEAEVLEHYISEELERLIAAEARRPQPRSARHPIPGSELDDRRPTDRSPLGRARRGETATFARVSDSDPKMLRYLGRARDPSRHATLRAVGRQPFGGPLRSRSDGTSMPGRGLAEKMRVEPAVSE